MMEQVMTLLSAACEPISQALVHSIWQGGLIASVLALSLILLKGSDPRIRYSLSCLALALIVASSLATGLYLAFDSNTNMAPAAGLPTAMAPAENSVDPVLASTGKAVVFRPIETIGNYWNYRSFFRWFYPVWVIGVLAISLYHLTGWRRIRRFVTVETTDVTDDWRQRLARLCYTLKVSRPVRMMASSLVRVPCVIGWIKPVILIPVSSLSGLKVDDLEMILTHELAHIRRHDILFSYLQTAVETLLFFNPAVWWISRQIRIEREHCCDDLAIGHWGDRLGYARALANLEALRGHERSFALAASDGSLINRVRRLVGISSTTGRISGAGAMAIFLLTATLVLGLGSIGGSSPANANETDQNLVEDFQPNDDDIKGEWELETDRGKIQLRMYFKRGWQVGFTVERNELVPEISASTRYFQLRRDAGTFHLEGAFETESGDLLGEGLCYFRADPGYVKEMRDFGFRLKSNRDVLSFALHDITLDFVRGLIKAGYDDLTDDELVTARIHDVTPEYISDLDELGYRQLDMDELVTMRIHDVEPEFIRACREFGYLDLSSSDLVTMQIHDVDEEFIGGLRQLGYNDLSSDQLVTMQIHDVEPDYIYQLRDLGYDHLSCDQLVTMRIHDVEPSFVREMAGLGYKDINPDKLVSLKIHDVTPRFIRDLKELGYSRVSLEDLISMQIHDVTASYIRKLQRRGYDDLSPEELIEYKIHNR